MPLVSLTDISKSFGLLKVIDGFSMDLDAGEALGIIGPNGAGKSTIFNIITGDLKPDAGRVALAGRDVTAMSVHGRCRAGIGRSYQIPIPFANISVFENLLVAAVFGSGAGERASRDRCGEILERLGLIGKANQRAGKLTLLERKRLEMARALATDPKILLLDEIAAGLTEHEVADLVETIRDIHAAGTAIIWIEHIVHAIVSVVGRLIVINFGRKLEEGDPRTVMASTAVQEVYLGISAE